MTWRSLMLGVAATLMMTFGSTAFAEPGSLNSYDSYDRRGGYLQASAIAAFAVRGDLSGESGGLSVRFGRRIREYIAAELQYDWTDFSTHQLTVNLRGYPLSSLILDGRIQPYGIAGFGFRVVDIAGQPDAGFAARFGLGIDFYATHNIVVTLESAYELTAAGTFHRSQTDFDMVSLSLGAAYRF